MTGRARRAAVVVALLLALSSGLVGARSERAGAGTGAPAGSGASIELLGQPAWVPTDGDVTFRLDIPARGLPVDEPLQLRIAAYNPVDELDELRESLAGEGLGRRISTLRLPLEILPRDEQGAALVTFGVGQSPTTPRLGISRAGVYPVELSVRADDEPLAAFVTTLVLVDEDAPVAPEDELRLSLVWQMSTGPVRGVDGAVRAGAMAELAPGGRLATFATLLDSARGIPLSMSIGPEVLESWAALAEDRADLRAGVEQVTAAIARATTQVLPVPYVPIDLTALEAAGLGSRLPEQLVLGSDTIEALAGATPDPRTAVVVPADAPTLARLRQLLVDRVVVSERGLLRDDDEPVLQPFVLHAGDGTIGAMADAPQITDELESAGSPRLRVQRALSALSVLALDPAGEPRGVVLSSPADWVPNLEVYRELVDAATDHPLLRPVTLDDFFAEVPVHLESSVPVVRELGPIEPAAFPVTGAQYDEAASALASIASSIDAGSTEVTQGRRALQIALSSEQAAADADAQLAVIDDGADRLAAGVSTARRRVTLTARRADVPLNFTNTLGQPVRVRVHLESPKLRFPEGNDVVVELPEGNSTQRFAVEARASGTFPMLVRVASADGNLPLGAPVRVSVRSAVFSGVGATLTIGALVFLAVWWANHYRRTRRARRAEAS